ncbi:uncharacterized protein crema isoform X2 [Brachyhypopomus gauderio]|uniref:uncharacterized protein crema isoform X2 n=1 Tax=Brachyhypopomus gauderio TaxID=698409 RepID=UPI0040413971
MEMVAAMQQRQEGSMTETETQVKGRVEERTGTDALTSSEGPTLQEQSAVQVTQPSVIQAPQIQTTQSVATEAERVVVSDTQKRRELLSRRPSYRKILNELSSDTPAVPKIEEEDNLEDEALSSSSVSTVTVPSSIYQTTSGQYSICYISGWSRADGPFWSRGPAGGSDSAQCHCTPAGRYHAAVRPSDWRPCPAAAGISWTCACSSCHGRHACVSDPLPVVRATTGGCHGSIAGGDSQSTAASGGGHTQERSSSDEKPGSSP